MKLHVKNESLHIIIDSPKLDVATSLDPDVEAGSLCLEVCDNGFVTESSVKDQLRPKAQPVSKVL